jgi:hypothetical protein
MSVTKNYNDMKKAADFRKERKQYVQACLNRVYDLYSSMFDFGQLGYKERTWVLGQLWSAGSVWVRKNEFTGQPVFCQYAGMDYDWYNQPTQVQLVSSGAVRAPESVIPVSRPQVVDEDGVICWIRPCHKGFVQDVMGTLDRLADCQMAINMNIYLQKFPWLIVAEPEMRAELQALVNKIFSDEPVIFMKGDTKAIQNIRLDTPYIVDKIRAYQTELANQLKTLLGIDNQGGFLNSQQQNLDTTNCNNEEINSVRRSYFQTLKESFDRANEICGLNLTVRDNHERAEQTSKTKDSGNHSHEEDRDEIQGTYAE